MEILSIVTQQSTSRGVWSSFLGVLVILLKADQMCLGMPRGRQLPRFHSRPLLELVQIVTVAAGGVTNSPGVSRRRVRWDRRGGASSRRRRRESPEAAGPSCVKLASSLH